MYGNKIIGIILSHIILHFEKNINYYELKSIIFVNVGWLCSTGSKQWQCIAPNTSRLPVLPVTDFHPIFPLNPASAQYELPFFPNELSCYPPVSLD